MYGSLGLINTLLKYIWKKKFHLFYALFIHKNVSQSQLL